MARMNFAMVRELLKCSKGVTAIEYALVASMISVACIGGMAAIGGQSNTGWRGVLERTTAALGY